MSREIYLNKVGFAIETRYWDHNRQLQGTWWLNDDDQKPHCQWDGFETADAAASTAAMLGYNTVYVNRTHLGASNDNEKVVYINYNIGDYSK